MTSNLDIVFNDRTNFSLQTRLFCEYISSVACVHGYFQENLNQIFRQNDTETVWVLNILYDDKNFEETIEFISSPFWKLISFLFIFPIFSQIKHVMSLCRCYCRWFMFVFHWWKYFARVCPLFECIFRAQSAGKTSGFTISAKWRWQNLQ